MDVEYKEYNLIICWSLHQQKVWNNFLHGNKTVYAFCTYKLFTKLRKKIDVHIFSKSIFYNGLMPICDEYLHSFWSAIMWNISQTLTLSFKKQKKKKSMDIYQCLEIKYLRNVYCFQTFLLLLMWTL